jgi:hypothetical protein
MERQKVFKGFTLFLAFAGTFALLVTSASTIWELAQPKAVSQSVSVSKDAQLVAQENGYWAVLQDEPNNRSAIGGLEAIAQAHAVDGNWSKSIAVIEKLRQAAPKSPNAKLYDRFLAELKKKAGAVPSQSPSSKP